MLQKFICLLSLVLPLNFYPQGIAKAEATAVSPTPVAFTELPNPPPAGIQILTEDNNGGPIPQNVIPLGGAVELVPPGHERAQRRRDAGDLVVKGLKATACTFPKDDVTHSGDMVQQRYFRATKSTTQSVKDNLWTSGGGGLATAFNASGGGSYNLSKKANEWQEWLLLGFHKESAFAISDNKLQYVPNVLDTLRSASTFEAFRQHVGDGIIRAQRITTGISVIINLSTLSKEKKVAIEGSFKANYAGVFNASGGGFRRTFETHATENVEAYAVSVGIQAVNLAGVLPLGQDNKNVRLRNIPEIASQSLAAIEDANQTAGYVTAVNLITPDVIPGFPLTGNAKINYDKVAKLYQVFVGISQSYAQLSALSNELLPRRIEIVDPSFDQNVQNTMQQKSAAKDAFDALFGKSLQDDTAFNSAYADAKSKLREFNNGLQSTLRQQVNVNLIVNEATIFEKLTKKVWTATANPFLLEPRSKYKVIMHTSDGTHAVAETKGELGIQTEATLKRGAQTAIANISSRYELKELLSPFSALMVVGPLTLKPVESAQGEVSLNARNWREFATTTGKSYPEESAPILVTLLAKKGSNWTDHFFKPRFDIAFRFAAKTTPQHLISFLSVQDSVQN